MSLYNLLHGVSGNARIALAMLDITPQDCGRFRDIWIEPGGTVISVFTRNGGGNREDYEDVTAALRSRPGYRRDFDDDFDCTYATYQFDVPPVYRELAAKLAPAEAPPSLQDKTQAACDAISATPPKNVPPDRVEEILNAIKDAVAFERQEKPKP